MEHWKRRLARDDARAMDWDWKRRELRFPEWPTRTPWMALAPPVAPPNAEVPRFEVRDFRIDNLRVKIVPDAWHGLHVHVSMRASDVESGKLITVVHLASVAEGIVRRDPEALTRAVETALLHILTHELAEKFYVNGKRFRDPHGRDAGL